MHLISRTPKMELLLRQRQLLSLEKAKPNTALECRQGVLWITASGDSQDHILHSGERYAIPIKDSKVVVEALENASINIDEN